MATFRYQPLPHDPQNPMIRIIELLPGSTTDAIQCNLLHAPLSNPPAYEALSYCWGSPLVYVEISCNSCNLGITTSLLTALIALRSKQDIRYVWVDAICIDQGNYKEKSSQVQLMGRIYRSATRVLVWLGECAEQSELVEALVPVLLEAKRKRAANNDERTLWDFSRVDLRYYGLPHFLNSAAYFPLCRLMSRPWFERVWIIQEITLAADAVVYCGEWKMPWMALVEAFGFLQDVGRDVFHGLLDSRNLQALQWERTRSASGRAQSLFSLLLRHQAALAGDSRDKVYALLGLACEEDVVEVDYSLSAKEVYVKATIKLLRQHQNLDVLSIAQVHDNEDLPSWVPDFKASQDTRLPLLLEPGDFEGEWLGFRAAGETRSNPTFKNNNTIMLISGMIVDEIVACGPVLEIRENYDLYSLKRAVKTMMEDPEQEAVLYHWEKVARARTGMIYVTGEPILDAYWQTLCILPQQAQVNNVRSAFEEYDDFRRLNRVLNALLLDVLALNYKNWPYKILDFVGGLCLILFRFLRWDVSPNTTFPMLMFASRGRKIVRTRTDYIGLASDIVSVGDKVGLFQGSKVPLVLRRKEPYWQMLGEAYIRGMVDGECFIEEECTEMYFC
jgi:Heterokaryon incompatibility protein (HET)